MKLDYEVKIAQWCAKQVLSLCGDQKQVKIGETEVNFSSSDDIANQAANQLKTNTIIFCLQNWLSLIDSDGLQELLAANPSLLSENKDLVSKSNWMDLQLTYSFKFIALFLHSLEKREFPDELKEKLGQIFFRIPNVETKLMLLELQFFFLFLTRSEVKRGDGRGKEIQNSFLLEDESFLEWNLLFILKFFNDFKREEEIVRQVMEEETEKLPQELRIESKFKVEWERLDLSIVDRAKLLFSNLENLILRFQVVSKMASMRHTIYFDQVSEIIFIFSFFLYFFFKEIPIKNSHGKRFGHTKFSYFNEFEV